MRPIRWLRSLFGWRTVDIRGVWLYRENLITGARRAVRISKDWGPVDHQWLNGERSELLSGPPRLWRSLPAVGDK